jgi:hypothetical protein
LVEDEDLDAVVWQGDPLPGIPSSDVGSLPTSGGYVRYGVTPADEIPLPAGQGVTRGR